MDKANFPDVEMKLKERFLQLANWAGWDSVESTVQGLKHWLLTATSVAVQLRMLSPLTGIAEGEFYQIPRSQGNRG